MRKSIKGRLVKSFVLVIVITVFIIELTLINGSRYYYYKAVENMVTRYIEMSMESLEYFDIGYGEKGLDAIVLDEHIRLLSHSQTEAQIIDLNGDVRLDTVGAMVENLGDYSDVQTAIGGQKGVWIGNVDYASKPVLSVSMPIMGQFNEIIGVIRFTTSLNETNRLLNMINTFMVMVGLVIVGLSTAVSVLLSNSIAKPLKSLNKVAEKMADGQYKVRSNIDLNDEIGQLSDTLNYMAEEIVKKEQIKNDFISSVSHELRTPLTSIKGWATTLKSIKPIDEDLLEDGLSIIEDETDRLSKMVEELLDFSRFTSGRIQLEKDPFDLRSTLNHIVTQMIPYMAKSGHYFIVDIADNFEVVVGDENRIKQVLINLLDNAIKFTDENGVISLFARRNNINQIIITIRDNGVGISEDEMPMVMEKFYKGEHSKSHSGIGLSVSKEIMNLHNGDIEIVSEIGRGTDVIMVLPVPKEAETIDETV